MVREVMNLARQRPDYAFVTPYSDHLLIPELTFFPFFSLAVEDDVNITQRCSFVFFDI